MIQDTAWQPVHKWFVTNRRVILNLFTALHWAVVIAIAATFFLLLTDMEWWLVLEPFAHKAGTISALLYLATHGPGILKRLNVLPLVRASWMLFRRQLGVLMFLTAIFHQTTLVTFPMLINFGMINLSVLTRREVYGLIAVCALFPMWLTSNDLSVKKLGPWWNVLHKLTYIALFFIYLHVATESETLRWLFIATMVLQAVSWVMHWVRMSRQKATNVPPTQQ